MKLELPKIKLFKKKDVDEVNFVPSFARDWKIIVSFFFLLVLIVFIGHFLAYWWLENYLSAQMAGGEGGLEKRAKVLDHALYENALSDIRDKQEKFTEYLTQPASLVDPSL